MVSGTSGWRGCPVLQNPYRSHGGGRRRSEPRLRALEDARASGSCQRSLSHLQPAFQQTRAGSTGLYLLMPAARGAGTPGTCAAWARRSRRRRCMRS